MRNAVVIQSSKAGMTVILDPELPFGELLDAIGKKFSESARFWGSVQMTLTLEGRDLTAAQEFAIVDTITKNSQIEVLCLLSCIVLCNLTFCTVLESITEWCSCIPVT